MRPLVAAIVLLLAAAFAGCTGPADVSIAGQGSKTGSAQEDLKCDGDGRISIGIQGSGEVRIRVTDGSGSTIFSDSFSGGGQQGETSQLSGSAGTWTLTATFSGTSSMPGMPDPGFQGQWAISLVC